MIVLWLAACLLSQSAAAQSAPPVPPPAPGPPAPAAGIDLELPDVTLFGRDTVYLAVPPPRRTFKVPLPPWAGVEPAGERLQLPQRLAPEAVPGPPPVVPVGSSQRAASAPGEEPAFRGGRQEAAEGAEGRGGSSASSWSQGGRLWDATVRYLPAVDLAGTLTGRSVRGSWSADSRLSVVLPDGWSSGRPETPGHVLLSAGGAHDGPSVRLSAGASAGLIDPPVNPGTYTLSGAQELKTSGQVVEFAEATALQMQSRSDPAETRVGAARQTVSLLLHGRNLGLSLEACGTARLESTAATPETGAAFTALASYRTSAGGLEIAAGASGLYHQERLSAYPAVAFELHPSAWLTLGGRGSAFLELASRPELYAAHTPASGTLLGPQAGYRLESRLGVDFTPGFEAAFRAWYVDGLLHRFDSQALLYENTRRAGGDLGLAWRGRSWASVHAQGSAEWSLSASPTLARRSVSAWLQGDFSKAPVGLIMLVSWGDLVGPGVGPGLLPEWEIFEGLEAALRGTLRLRRDRALEGGLQLLVPQGATTPRPRFLLGYSARLGAPGGDIRWP